MELLHLDLGILDSDAGRRDEALRELKEAARLRPQDATVHYRLARLYKAMGRNAEASVEFQKTSSLHKAEEATVFQQLERARAKGKTAEEPEATSKD
jgi:Flp pilus assembly protein TadD